MKADAAFVSDWRASQGAVLRVAEWLAGFGGEVVIPAPHLRKDAATRMLEGDRGDILYTEAVEVKQRQIAFTGAADYPFPTVFVDEVYKVDRRVARTRAWVVVNRDGTCLAVIPKATRREWVVVERPDAAQGRVCQWYACPVARVTFVALGEAS